MFGRPEKLFVSHSSKNKPFVRAAILPLIRGAGRSYWYDEDDIKASAKYRDVLLSAILEECDRILVVASKEALESEWVKQELSIASRELLARKAKIDARMVHRRILPVKIEERDEFGDVLAAAPNVDLFALHPYLTLVNFISVPYNSDLDRKIQGYRASTVALKKLAAFLQHNYSFTPEQCRSAIEYFLERQAAQRKLSKALRDPNILEHGRSAFDSMRALVLGPAMQRLALAAGLLAALFWLVRPHTQELPERSIDLEVTTEPAASSASLIASRALTVPLDASPTSVVIRASTSDGMTASTRVDLRVDRTTVRKPIDSVEPQPADVRLDVTHVETPTSDAVPRVFSMRERNEYFLARASAGSESDTQLLQIQSPPAAERGIEVVSVARNAEQQVVHSNPLPLQAGPKNARSFTSLSQNFGMMIRGTSQDNDEEPWRYVKVNFPYKLPDPPKVNVQVTPYGENIARVVSVGENETVAIHVTARNADGTLIHDEMIGFEASASRRSPTFHVAPVSDGNRGLRRAVELGQVDAYDMGREPSYFRIACAVDGVTYDKYLRINPPEPPDEIRGPETVEVAITGGEQVIRRELNPNVVRNLAIELTSGHRGQLSIRAVSARGEVVRRSVPLIVSSVRPPRPTIELRESSRNPSQFQSIRRLGNELTVYADVEPIKYLQMFVDGRPYAERVRINPVPRETPPQKGLQPIIRTNRTRLTGRPPNYQLRLPANGTEVLTVLAQGWPNQNVTIAPTQYDVRLSGNYRTVREGRSVIHLVQGRVTVAETVNGEARRDWVLMPGTKTEDPVLRPDNPRVETPGGILLRPGGFQRIPQIR